MNDATQSLLPVDLAELCVALEAEAADLRWFFDLKTGAVILVTREYEPQEYDGVTVDDIEANAERFRRVPPPDPQALTADMRAFLGKVADPKLVESLELALSAPRPERRFKAVLSWLPEVQGQWHDFRQARCEARARGWLESLGVQCRFSPPEP